MLCLLRINAAMLIGAVMLAGLPGEAFPRSAETDLLQLESKIPLGNVRGRIDHMAVDVNRQRLYDVSLGDRVRLLSFLDEYGPAPLAACMSVIWNARDPVGALATLALRRFIDIEIDETLLGPDTIRIRQRHNIPSSTLAVDAPWLPW